VSQKLRYETQGFGDTEIRNSNIETRNNLKTTMSKIRNKPERKLFERIRNPKHEIGNKSEIQIFKILFGLTTEAQSVRIIP
jgi:hypothetical protein